MGLRRTDAVTEGVISIDTVLIRANLTRIVLIEVICILLHEVTDKRDVGFIIQFLPLTTGRSVTTFDVVRGVILTGPIKKHLRGRSHGIGKNNIQFRSFVLFQRHDVGSSPGTVEHTVGQVRCHRVDILHTLLCLTISVHQTHCFSQVRTHLSNIHGKTRHFLLLFIDLYDTLHRTWGSLSLVQRHRLSI